MTATLSPAPVRSEAQRRDALVLANGIRIRRARLKRELAAGEVRASDVIADPPEWAARMRVFDVLVAQRGWGLAKTRRLMWRLRISESKTVGGMSDRQRAELAEAIS